jgi:hypothetical protein
MTRQKNSNFLVQAFAVFVAAGLFLGEIGRIVAYFLASGTTVHDSNDASNNAARGGVLNYRTMMFDDGTDASGWYEKD